MSADHAEELRPGIVIVSRDSSCMDDLEEQVSKRYAADYRITDCHSVERARDDLIRFTDDGRPIALVLAAYDLEKDTGGLEFLKEVRALHPTAKRVAVVRWGDFQTVDPVFEAITRGDIDHWVYRPERARDEVFHRSITEFLENWSADPERVRIIGDPKSARVHELRDGFGQNQFPARVIDAASPEGREKLADLGLESPKLPVVQLLLPDARPLQDPDFL
ncbi:MAG: hypothetical protein ACRDKZ_00725, partial [Actinomycetota bacterium]